jgi:hypothetical protein
MTCDDVQVKKREGGTTHTLTEMEEGRTNVLTDWQDRTGIPGDHKEHL